MAEIKQSAFETSQALHDFKLVDGIGPAVEKRLHAAGVHTYAQLASLKSENLAKLLEGMVGYSPNRIKEQDWSGQAHVLAGQAEKSIPEEIHEPANNSLHYASYTVELLLDRDNKVRRTRVVHVQSHQEISWAGWNEDRLCSFVADSGQLRIIATEEGAFVEESTISKYAPSPTFDLEPSHSAPTLKGATKIIETRLVNQAGQPLGALIPSNKPFEVQLLLDLSQVEAPKGERLNYDATIYLRKIGNHGRDISGGKEGSLAPAKSAVIDISNRPLAPGDYRLEGLVALRPHSQPKRLKNQLMAMTESMLLHVA